MNEKLFCDTLTVSKGPEDGVSFLITSTPVLVGREPSCLVNLQLDVTVQAEHARIAVGRGGYRVRRITGAPTVVNGVRAGRILSRTLKDGQILRVGYTELILRCAENGHAATASPSWTESDVVWAARAVLDSSRSVVRSIVNWTFARLRMAARIAAEHWIVTLLALALLAYFTVDPVRKLVDSWVSNLRS